jgi:hypothetical protein
MATETLSNVDRIKVHLQLIVELKTAVEAALEAGLEPSTINQTLTNLAELVGEDDD